MSNYGRPDGPYPGQPQEPWSGRQPTDTYGQPSDPWGGHDPWGGAPSSTHPVHPGSPGAYDPGYGGYPDPGYSGYGPAQHYEHPFQPAGPDPVAPLATATKRTSKGPVIALVVALAVLVFGGGATAIYLLGRDDGTPATQPTSEPNGGSSPTSEPTATTPRPESSTDARFVKAGQCVKNEGAAGKPRLVIIKCGAKTYEVLARFDGVTSGQDDARTKCARVSGYTDWYFFNSELDTLDFVLCLKERRG